MNKIINTSLALFLFSGLSHAGNAVLAIQKQVEKEDIVLPVTLNNQSNTEVTTDSGLVSTPGKMISAQEAAIFEIKVPNQIGIHRIRYGNGSQGCDFYLDVQNGMIPYSGLNTFITAVAIESGSICKVSTVGNTNHLSVSFQKWTV